MGAQDNLTNVLAVVLGVAIGAGRSDLVALAGLVCFAAAMVAGLVPLVPFAFLPLQPAVLTCLVISILALFGLGSWAGGVTGRGPWRDGVRLVLIAGTAALAAAVIGLILRID